METKTINLRAVPEEFVRRAKAHAAINGMTLKELVIVAVEKFMQEKPATSRVTDSKQRTKK